MHDFGPGYIGGSSRCGCSVNVDHPAGITPPDQQALDMLLCNSYGACARGRRLRGSLIRRCRRCFVGTVGSGHISNHLLQTQWINPLSACFPDASHVFPSAAVGFRNVPDSLPDMVRIHDIYLRSHDPRAVLIGPSNIFASHGPINRCYRAFT